MKTNPEMTQMTESVDKHIRTVNVTVFCLFKEPVERSDMLSTKIEDILKRLKSN